VTSGPSHSRKSRPDPRRPWLASVLVGAVVIAVIAPIASAEARVTATTVAREVSGPVSGKATFELPITASHVAVHWRGHRSARVRVALSRDGVRYTSRRIVEFDEVAESRGGRETYGAVTPAPGVSAVRVWTDRRLRRLSVLALADRKSSRDRRRSGWAKVATHIAQPSVISRAGWGADESLRFDSNGNEKWPPAFYPIQKLIVHHTAGVNDDPDPPATIRSIYYYHAITQGYGDIGYNFLIDEAGRVYEGRYSRPYAATELPTGEDSNGNGVTAAHAQGYNSGTVGIALLGTLTSQDATPAARSALEEVLAWKGERHGIDPQGSSLYTNPVNGTQKTFPNIAGHRDVAATECPGSVFYSTLPTIRQGVAARIAGSPPPPAPTVKYYQPTGYAPIVGTAYSGRGAVSRLWDDDGNRLEIVAANVNGRYVSRIKPYASITDAERAALKKLTVDYDGNASSGAVAITLSIYNFATGRWEIRDGPRTGVTSDRRFTWSNTTSPVDYVSPAGRIRFSVKGAHASSFRTRTDWVRFTVEY
jgi:N-acetylmuramoyl-L-alanine amidase